MRQTARRYFYPRPPRGGRRRSTARCASQDEFLSTPSARRATHLVSFGFLWFLQISIHALREEGDFSSRKGRIDSKAFLSTPSARRATAEPGSFFAWSRYFYPRPPRGGRHGHVPASRGDDHISIHALREEGDLSCACFLAPGQIISIHALREEGDACALARLRRGLTISIHALREEGDW